MLSCTEPANNNNVWFWKSCSAKVSCLRAGGIQAFDSQDLPVLHMLQRWCVT